MAQNIQQLPLTMRHGHTDDRVAITFNRPIDHVFMTPTEATALIDAVQGSIKLLAEHQQRLASPKPAPAANEPSQS